MKLKKTKVGDFEVCELSVREMLPVMKLMGEDSEAGQLEMLGTAVKLNGTAIGSEAIQELGMGMYMKLIGEVTKINGLDDSLGND